MSSENEESFQTADEYEDAICQLELRIANEDANSSDHKTLEKRLQRILSQTKPTNIQTPPQTTTSLVLDEHKNESCPIPNNVFKEKCMDITRQQMSSLMNSRSQQHEQRYSIHSFKHTLLNLLREEAIQMEIPIVYASDHLQRTWYPLLYYRREEIQIEASLFHLVSNEEEESHTSVCLQPNECEFRKVDCGLLTETMFCARQQQQQTITKEQRADDVNSSHVSFDVSLERESSWFIRERDIRRLLDGIRQRLSQRVVVRPATLAVYVQLPKPETDNATLVTKLVWIYPLNPLDHAYAMLDMYSRRFTTLKSTKQQHQHQEEESYWFEQTALNIPITAWNVLPVSLDCCVGRYYQYRMDTTVITLAKTPLRAEFLDQEWRYLVYRNSPIPESIDTKRHIPVDQLLTHCIRILFTGFNISTYVNLANPDDFKRIHNSHTHDSHLFDVSLSRYLTRTNNSNNTSCSKPNWIVHWDNLISWIRILYAFLLNVQKALLPTGLGNQTIWVWMDEKDYHLYVGVSVVRLERDALVESLKVRQSGGGCGDGGSGRSRKKTRMTMRQLETLVCETFQRNSNIPIHLGDSCQRITDKYKDTYDISIREIDICDVETEMMEEVSVFSKEDCNKIVCFLQEEEKAYYSIHSTNNPSSGGLQFGLVFASGLYRMKKGQAQVTHVTMKIIVLFPRCPDSDDIAETMKELTVSKETVHEQQVSSTVDAMD